MLTFTPPSEIPIHFLPIICMIIIMQVPDFNTLKEDGNKLFKEGRISEALDVYTKALGIVDIKDGDKAVIFKNRAACHLKTEDYQSVIDDCTSCKFHMYR